jgi:hypothetical protein
MSGPTPTSRRNRLVFVAIATVLAIGATAAASTPAKAFWIGFPFGGYYPAPYAYAPPPYYYAPPPAAYYPPASYPVDPGYAAQPAPPAYSQQTAPSAYSPPATAANPAPQITYTSKPAFRDASGQTCREYTTNSSAGKAVFGTACQAADGQWRVVN